LISRTVPISLYTAVNEPIQQHTAVRYNSCLRWTARNLSLSATNCHPFLFFRFPTSYQNPSAFCVSWLLFVVTQLSLLQASEEKKNLIFIEQGKANFTLLREYP